MLCDFNNGDRNTLCVCVFLYIMEYRVSNLRVDRLPQYVTEASGSGALLRESCYKSVQKQSCCETLL